MCQVKVCQRTIERDSEPSGIVYSIDCGLLTLLLFASILYPLHIHLTCTLTEKGTSATVSMSEHRNLSEESLKKHDPKSNLGNLNLNNLNTTANTTASGLSGADFRKLRPGYSSGASSFSGSDAGSFDSGEDGAAMYEFDRSRHHSAILDLAALRQEMMIEGDLTKTVVRIEVRYCIVWTRTAVFHVYHHRL